MLLASPALVVRVLSPSLVFLVTLSIAILRPPSPPSSSSIAVAKPIPRRELILSLLSLSALTYLFDGLAFIILALIAHHWPHHTGIPFNAIVGLVAFSGLAAFGTWKDAQGTQVWALRRMKVATIATLLLDICLSLAWVELSSQKRWYLTIFLFLACRVLIHPLNALASPRIPEVSPIYAISTMIHVIAPAFRVLLLLPLLAGLMSPRINYSPVLSYDNIEQPTPTDSSFLLPRSEAESSATLSTLPGPAEENSKYGTFHTAPSDLQPSTSPTQAATPAPSTPEDPEVWNNFF